MADFSKQVVLITGSADGIGRQLAREFARRGATIVAIDLAEAPLQRLATELKASGARRVGLAVADVSQRSAMQDAVAHLDAKDGPIDLVIANAGIGEENPIVGFDAGVFTRMIEVNLLGVANTFEAVLPGMIERRRGHLVALSSLASYRGLPLMAGYCASKAGVSSFLDSLRVELKDFGIHCTTICPGFIHTNMTRDKIGPQPGIMALEPAVARMMRAIERKQKYLAFPFRNRLLLTLNRLMPTSWGDYLTLKVMGSALRNRMQRPGPGGKV
jgi:short-subunit dehydrogenase